MRPEPQPQLETRTFQADARSGELDEAIKLFHRATGIGFYEQLPDEPNWKNYLDLTYAQKMRFCLVFDPHAEPHSRHATEPVHTYGAFPGLLNAGGGEPVPAHKITSVTVAPSYRRRGVLGRQITADLAYAQQEGFPLSALTASEATIYGRYGFEPATFQCRFTLKCAGGLKLRVQLPGKVVDADPARLEADYSALAVRAFERTFGSVDSTEYDNGYALGRWDNWETLDKPKNLRFAAYYDDAGQLGGFATYKFGGWDEPRAKLVVNKLVATSDAARIKLFEYLGNHDLVEEVHGQGPVADPMRQVLDNVRDYHVRSIDDSLWLRVLDVAAAFQVRSYQHDARLLLRVNDRMDLISGTYLFDVADARATVTRVDEGQSDPDLPLVALSEREVAGLYLGTVQLDQLLDSGRAELVGGAGAGNWRRAFSVAREGFTPHGF
ncbi:GNAT family N-acetyltransferase [Glutamicibacter nicotianae]|uniref:GNAT family N-acetyltransferase n=1 Tax=Glutamicibacter nicotianae TaxID=37929 RepID=UPI001957B7D0|nr:GNAT family N-acetyltransferase [Glutamicibacter nicotianae]MBM7768752.1 putative acetyltransferase [Glutamicibacter nicotianae]